MSGASDLTVTVGCDAERQRQRAHADAVAAADRDAWANDRGKAGHRDFNRIGIGGHVRYDEIPGNVGDDRRHSGAAGLAQQRDGRARHREALLVLDRTGDRTGRDLRRHRNDGECPEHPDRDDDARVRTPRHGSPPDRNAPTDSGRADGSARAGPRTTTRLQTKREYGREDDDRSP